ncbi:hypothetical protein VE04_00679 [Pseudogymnoascus sp. 24MN13]|nr:hypothetical protein VE04_00679 [Pseudogymnoascus sp. 24MN13]
MGPSAISRQRQGKKANESYGAGCVVQKANESYGAGCVVQKANESYGAGCMFHPSKQLQQILDRNQQLVSTIREHGASLNFAGCQGLDLDLSLSTDGL